MMASLDRKGIETHGLALRIQSPIRFISPQGGFMVHGHEASILPGICAALIEAGRLGKLQPQQDGETTVRNQRIELFRVVTPIMVL